MISKMLLALVAAEFAMLLRHELSNQTRAVERLFYIWDVT